MALNDVAHLGEKPTVDLQQYQRNAKHASQSLIKNDEPCDVWGEEFKEEIILVKKQGKRICDYVDYSRTKLVRYR